MSVRNNLPFIAVHYAKLPEISHHLNKAGTHLCHLQTNIVEETVHQLESYQMKWKVPLVRSATVYLSEHCLTKNKTNL